MALPLAAGIGILSSVMGSQSGGSSTTNIGQPGSTVNRATSILDGGSSKLATMASAFSGMKTTLNAIGIVASDMQARDIAAARGEALENNASLADWEANYAVQSGLLNIKQFQKQFQQLQGATRVAAASSGVVVNQGSALDVLVDNAGQAARQEEMMRFEANVASYKKTQEANNYRYQAAIVRASAPSELSTAVGVLGEFASFAAGSF